MGGARAGESNSAPTHGSEVSCATCDVLVPFLHYRYAI
jgi:hypothetical protein